MKTRRYISRSRTTMKPLALLSSEIGIGRANNLNHKNDNMDKDKSFHLIGIDYPEENTNKCKGWIIIVTSMELSQDLECLKIGDIKSLGQLNLSANQQVNVLSHFSPKKISCSLENQEFIYFGKYAVQDLWNKPSEKAPFAFLGKQNWNLLDNELEKHGMVIIPLAENHTSGPEKISTQKIKGFWTRNTKKSYGFLKWITKLNKSSRVKRIQELACHDDDAEEDFENEKVEEKKLIIGKKKFLFTKKNNMRKTKEKNCGKVKRIINVNKRNEMEKEEEENDDEIEKGLNQLIRIELKPDPMLQEPSFQFSSGDLLRLKVTMYEAEGFGEGNDHQVEIDFVQNFMCEADTMNACRCRRITKLLKRSVVSDMKWEKGVHISGNVFALCWIPYKIPGESERENGGELCENEEEVCRDFCVGSLDEKFRVTGCQYELQIRFYENDVLAACSCFPMNILMTTSVLADDGFLEGVKDEEDINSWEVEKDIGVGNNLVKSLSAVEFDV